MKRASIILVFLILLGCQPTKQQRENIRFEIKNFELRYELNKSQYAPNESYGGKGVIFAVGDQNLINKPYLVLIKTTKVKGGLETATEKEWVYYSIVNNGIGEVTTYDWHNLYGDEKFKSFEKPEYKIEILGYIPFIIQK